MPESRGREQQHDRPHDSIRLRIPHSHASRSERQLRCGGEYSAQREELHCHLGVGLRRDRERHRSGSRLQSLWSVGVCGQQY